RTDVGGVLPERTGVHRRLRPDPQPARAAAHGRAHLPPRPDEPRARDRGRRRRRGAVGRARAGLQRARDPDGRALPPARRGPSRRNGLMSLVIKGASLLGEETRDLYVDDAGVLVDSAPSGAETIDADGLVALPGLVDLHTHLREPGREDAETILTGSQAAAAGGYTAVHAMANTSPVADTAGVVEQVHRLGRAAGYTQVEPVGAVTVGLAGETLAELGAMADSAASVRVFSDDGISVDDAVLMRRALEYVK